MKWLNLIIFLFITTFCFAEEINWNKLVQAIIICESSGNPNAYNSKSGCRGLMQISEIVLQEFLNQDESVRLIVFGNNGYIEYTPKFVVDLYNPTINKQIGTWYLKRL